MSRTPMHLLIAFLALLPAAGAAAQDPPDLTGVWVLNEAESDTIALPSSDSERNHRAVRIGVNGWPAGVQHRSISDPYRMRRAVQAVRDAPDRLFIVRTDTTATLSFDAEPPATFWTDGRDVERLWTDGEPVEVRAEWEGGALRITRELEEEIEVTDTYRLSGRRLVVRTVVEGPIPRRIELRRVYDRAPPEG
jgi:hypothetical protein